MKQREFTCLNCGAKGIDTSKSQSRKFCDYVCKQAYYRKQHGVGDNTVAHLCMYNMNVRCFAHKCRTCGWNPKVEQKRKEALGYG